MWYDPDTCADQLNRGSCLTWDKPTFSPS
jgi:hypothetical protein